MVQSYPTWTDEHGANVEQLAAIAVSALAEHGMLVQPTVDVDRPEVIDLEAGPDRTRAVDA
jgi:hypothetical protein